VIDHPQKCRVFAGCLGFKDGNPSDEAVHKACFSCHEPAKDRDFVFTRYAPF
jgi:hypothetical protein